MSRQIQIRRGTTTQHESFTGAPGEVTMDIDQKTLRVHDGQTPGGIPLARQDEIPENTTLPDTYDFVIESVTTPTAWYRKYKSGWIEQGGCFTSNASNNGNIITLPKAMQVANYSLTIGLHAAADPNGASFKITTQTKTTFGGVTTWSGNVGTGYLNVTIHWEARGMSGN